MRIPFVVAVSAATALWACSKTRRIEELSARFAEIAALPRATGPSDALVAALEEFEAHAAEVRAALDGAEWAYVPLSELVPQVGQVFGGVMDALESGERLPIGDCAAKLKHFQIHGALVRTAPLGDELQLEAALQLARDYVDTNPGAIGAMMSLSAFEDVIHHLVALKIDASSAMRAIQPPEGLVRQSYARECLCNAQLLDKAVSSEDGKGGLLGAAVLEDERAAFYASREATMDRVEAVKDQPHKVVAELGRAYREAQDSDSRVVKTLAVIGSAWEDMEDDRQRVAAYFAGRRWSQRKSGAAQRPAMPAESLALTSPVYVPCARGGLRVLGLPRGHALYALGLRNGDVITRIDDASPTANDLPEALAQLATGHHTIALERRAKPLSLQIGEGVDAATDAEPPPVATPQPPAAVVAAADTSPPRTVARSRVKDARALRLELEGSGIALDWDAREGGYVVSDAAAGTLAAALGLEVGDVLRSLNDRTAGDARSEGQTGIGFLVDGLGDDEASAEIARGGRITKLRWRFD